MTDRLEERIRRAMVSEPNRDPVLCSVERKLLGDVLSALATAREELARRACCPVEVHTCEFYPPTPDGCAECHNHYSNLDTIMPLRKDLAAAREERDIQQKGHDMWREKARENALEIQRLCKERDKAIKDRNKIQKEYEELREMAMSR